MPLDVFYFYHAVHIYFRRNERVPVIFTHALRHHALSQNITYDVGLLLSSLSLLLFGLVMMTSASIDIAQIQYGDSFYYFWRQLIYIFLGIGVATIVLHISIKTWQHWSPFILFICIFLLGLVLIPGLGQEINGSRRWISLGFIHLQPAELIKLSTLLYLADYLVRRHHEIRIKIIGTIKPLIIVSLMTSLLLLQPDYGAIVVLFATVLGMLFLAGVPTYQFLLWITGITVILSGIAILAPYRIERLTTFLDPWADPFDKGFQLTQALIAIGRGELGGVGLGFSVQKFTFLPEAHTDFVFAILAEELGLIGVISLMSLFTWMVMRAFIIAIRSEILGLPYAAYLSYGIGLEIAVQTFINLGVNMGILPTKGLTLPLISYGGSSMIVTCLMLALLLRVDYETRLRNESSRKL